MDILQEIYFMWDERYALGKLKNSKELRKREKELEDLRKDFFKKVEDKENITEIKKIFGDVVDAENSTSEVEQNIYFVEGFKQGVKFIVECFS